jgi:hypothetical protein
MPHAVATLSEFIRQLDDLAAGCDPDFDMAYGELEREFAERRLSFSDAE